MVVAPLKASTVQPESLARYVGRIYAHLWCLTSSLQLEKGRESAMTVCTCRVFPPFHEQEDEEHYHWKRKHRRRDRNEARQRRQTISSLLPKS